MKTAIISLLTSLLVSLCLVSHAGILSTYGQTNQVSALDLLLLDSKAGAAYVTKALTVSNLMQWTNLNGTMPFFTNGATIFVDPNGNDTNDGFTLARPRKTFAGVNAIIKPGYTVYFLPGVYAAETVTLNVTNNNVVAYGATHNFTGTINTPLINLWSGASGSTNGIYGGTWINTNANSPASTSGCIALGGATTNITIFVKNTACYGVVDTLHFNFANNTAFEVHVENNYLYSADWDAFAIFANGNGAGTFTNFNVTNAQVFAVGNTIVTQDGGSGVSRGLSTAYCNLFASGNMVQVQGTVSSDNIIGIDCTHGIAHLAGNTINLIGPNAQYIDSENAAGGETFFVAGHPWPETQIKLYAASTINFVGWGDFNGSTAEISGAAGVGSLNVTNNATVQKNLFVTGSNVVTGPIYGTSGAFSGFVDFANLVVTNLTTDASGTSTFNGPAAFLNSLGSIGSGSAVTNFVAATGWTNTTAHNKRVFNLTWSGGTTYLTNSAFAGSPNVVFTGTGPRDFVLTPNEAIINTSGLFTFGRIWDF